MSDNTQPASSRRALREKRRAEMEALLANSKAEQEAREQAAREEGADSKKAPQPAAAPGKQTPRPSSTSGSNTSKPASGAKSTPQNAPKTGEAPKKPANKSGAAKPAEAKKDTAKSGATQQHAKPEAAKNAAENPVATKPAATKSSAPKPAVAKPASKTADAKTPNGKPTDAKAGDSKPAAQSSESESGDSAVGERASLRRARDREALRERRRLQEEVSQLTNHVPAVEPGDDPKPLTRRQLRLQALAEQQKAENTGTAKPVPVKPQNSKPAKDEDSPETTVMSVEEALAARRESAPTPPVDPNLLRDDDNDIDLEVLAHQREMAARAAIISRRAAERERLRQQNAKAGQEAPASDPFTGAMGNISELEDKVSRSGVPSPKTESVSLDLDSTGKIAPAKKPADKTGKKPEAKPDSKAPAKEAAKPAPKPAAQKPAVKKAMPAAKPKPKEEEQATSAQATSGDPVQMPRVDAVSAQGLQPLDAQTAGVRRANNMFLAMIAALAVGGIALVVGIIMMLNN
ncbi:hypothetical protein GcLGCM259_1589 [Glutamicibacter creatinolyticus]|uniref:Uncharacterized protein n=1 Tax=Glutamicibacter creatinolyticus TaxID=162496 RepID=A0A5B7WTJ1_9MICC|nr:hypothetical protein [Glutamicibacter creatinolyticus]QCY47318.1 hypothetical protein GcLGCM259_1589 [Glutamicibacter creatinolyticus]